VVGRLVQHEEVGLHDEKAGEVGAHDPAAAEGAGGHVVVPGAEGEAGEDALGLGFELVAFELDEAFGGGEAPGCVRVGMGAEGGVDFLELGGDRGGELDDGFLADGGALLREVADAEAALGFHLALVGFGLAEEDGKEGGLARAVRPDQADAVAAVEAEGKAGEKDFGAVAFAKLGDGEHEAADRNGFSAKVKNDPWAAGGGWCRACGRIGPRLKARGYGCAAGGVGSAWVGGVARGVGSCWACGRIGPRLKRAATGAEGGLFRLAGTGRMKKHLRFETRSSWKAAYAFK